MRGPGRHIATGRLAGGTDRSGGLMIAAGVNAKALSVYMGHSSVTITLDRATGT